MSRYSTGLYSLLERAANDVVIVSTARTPFTRSTKGALAHMLPEELLSTALQGSMDKLNIEKDVIEDITVGAVCQKLGGQKVSSVAVKSLGFPVSTTVNTVNRQCASSAQAMSYIAASIKAGWMKAGIAAGVESMSLDYFPSRNIPDRVSQEILEKSSDEAKAVLMPMILTSENVSKKFGISRQDQDAFAKLSHDKAAAGIKQGYFDREIVPVNARLVAEDGTVNRFTSDRDDGVRATVSLEKLSSLKPVVNEDSVTTAGNISDGASSVVLMSREKADELGLSPIGKFVASTVAGVEAALMGIGPSAAVPKLLAMLNLELGDIDIFELNEAFASQSLYCIEKLKLDHEKVNPYGGAIAIGHPLGATGGRLVGTLLNGLHTKDKDVGIMSMCMSTGQGYAGLLLRE